MTRDVRNYDWPNPSRVASNIKQVLSHRNMDLLDKGSYELLITHCGFIAHYGHGGFIATYKDDMAAFVEQFLEQDGMGWTTSLNNTGSYLYDTSYRGKLLADIIRELLPIFRAYQRAIEAAHALDQNMKAEAQLRDLAERLGYDLVKKQETEEAA